MEVSTLMMTWSFSSVWDRALSNVSKSVAVLRVANFRFGLENWYAGQNFDRLLSPMRSREAMIKMSENTEKPKPKNQDTDRKRTEKGNQNKQTPRVLRKKTLKITKPPRKEKLIITKPHSLTNYQTSAERKIDNHQTLLTYKSRKP